ncbi:hypothetical protein ACF08N_35480 [Streptomyces sp. NPDC015127]|uniref:hypothetical protein n=1 Tax=Streptomyces sp. NPDC015127 TaxID=3364939 RepID=UPI0036FF724C
MEAMLCACCKQLAARDERGMAWLLPSSTNATDTVWEGVRTVIPPMCEVCADLAPRACPGCGTATWSSASAEAEQIGV